MRRHKPFRDIPAFYTDGGDLVVSRGGEVSNDQDIARFFKWAEPELDRITLEMCAYHRAKGEKLEQWQKDAELSAFGRSMRGDGHQ